MRFAATCSLALLLTATAPVCAASEPAAELEREAVFLQKRIRIGEVSSAELRETGIRIAALGRMAGRDVAGLVEAVAVARDGLHVWRHPDCASRLHGPGNALGCARLLRPVFGRVGLPTPSVEALMNGADLKPLLTAVSHRSDELLQALNPPSAAGSATLPSGRHD